MEQKHIDLIRKNKFKLIQHIEVNEEFLAILQDKYTLTPSMYENVKQPHLTNTAKCVYILDALKQRGSTAFSELIRALQSTGQYLALAILGENPEIQHLQQKLQATEMELQIVQQELHQYRTQHMLSLHQMRSAKQFECRTCSEKMTIKLDNL